MKNIELTSFLMELMRGVGVSIVMPRFRSVSELEISEKSHKTDLVTEADLASEDFLTKSILSKIPNSVVVGEEAVSKDPSVLGDLSLKNKYIFVIDPIDGTYCYAKGLSTFGIILSVIYNGEVIVGLHYDPVNDDFIVSERGSGTEYINSSGERKRLNVSKNYDLSEMNGFVPYYIFSYKFGRKVAENILMKFLEFERINSLRCSLHEYNQMCFANAEFSLSTHTNIWDHGAGQLMLSECGGVSGILGEGVSKFKPYGNSGFLLSANSEDVWYKINDIFLSAIKS